MLLMPKQIRHTTAAETAICPPIATETFSAETNVNYH